MVTVKLPILHFNDVYRVQPQKLPSSSLTVSASQFTQNLKAIRDGWPPPTEPDESKDGLVLFSGDLFSPSLESGVTRGSHMVPVINMIKPTVALTGNHDFDFGYPHLTKLVNSCQFPWLLSNIIDRETGTTPASLHKYHVVRKCGLTIGFIGLVEEEWITTVSSWPPNFDFQPMDQVGKDLSEELRGSPHHCDLIIALTHARLPNDITLAKQLGARRHADAAEHGVDILFGGHDHMYYIGRGISNWEGWDFSRKILGAAGDEDALLVKSGTDFRDLSELVLELEETPERSVRKRVVKSVQGKRHSTKHDWSSSSEFDDMIKSVIGDVKTSLSKPVCKTLTQWDVRSEHVRTQESAIGNWMADVLRHAYDEAICIKDHPNGGADGVLLCGGTFRGDSLYGPGKISLGDIYEILPFEDPIVMLELTGEAIWDALESGFSTWPAQEGRFPVVAGLAVKWDSRRSPGQRVLDVHLIDDKDSTTSSSVSAELRLARPVLRNKHEKFAIVTRQYMAEGFDGYDALKGQRYLIDDENGIIMSSLIRKFLLGSQFIHEQKNYPQPNTEFLHPKTDSIVANTRSAPADSPERPMPVEHSKMTISDAFHVVQNEHMSAIDFHDGEKTRRGIPHKQEQTETINGDLIVIAPSIDGRLLDIGRDT